MKKLSVFTVAVVLGTVGSANALQYQTGRNVFELNASGTAGIFEPKFKDVVFLGDFEVGAKYKYAVNNNNTLGLVYEYNAESVSENDYAHDAFALWEMRGVGRIEAGITESVAYKLGVGLPDVGGLRINHKPLFYKKIVPHGAIIPNTTVSTGHDAPRVNLATAPIGHGQYGVSVSAFGDEYNYAIDGGVKFRFPDGKLKSAISLAGSFMDKPNGFSAATYVPDVYADWRAQGSIGFNLQYNSWIWGTSVLAIYDKNPVFVAADGISAGTGISYDILNYSLSASYLYSKTGIWHDEFEPYYDHTVIGSFRYKYSENVELWASVGLTSEKPFLSSALKVSF